MSGCAKKNYGNSFQKHQKQYKSYRDFPQQQRRYNGAPINGNSVLIFSRRNSRINESSELPWSRGVSISVSSSVSRNSTITESAPKTIIRSPVSNYRSHRICSERRDLESYCQYVKQDEPGSRVQQQRKGGVFRFRGSIQPMSFPSSPSVPFSFYHNKEQFERRRCYSGRPSSAVECGWRRDEVEDMSRSLSQDLSLDEQEYCFGPAPFHGPRTPFYRMIDPLSTSCRVSDQILEYFLKHQQSLGSFRRKLCIRDAIFGLIRNSGGSQYEKCGMYIIGSSLNGFATNSSDLDICLMVEMDEIPTSRAVALLRDVEASLEGADFHDKVHLIEAKKPILRLNLKEEFGGVQVDLNANNPVTIQNTHLLHYYAQFDWRVRPLALAVKRWASTIGINDSRNATFTSYSLILMVIHFLQRTTPAVLPNLHLLYPNKFSSDVDVRSLSTDEPLDPYPSHLFAQHNSESLSSLFHGFLTYYRYFFKHHMDKLVVSIRSSDLGRGQADIPSATPLFVEDPFSRMNTACAAFDGRIFEQKIRAAFERSQTELGRSWDMASFLGWAEEFRRASETERHRAHTDSSNG